MKTGLIKPLPKKKRSSFEESFSRKGTLTARKLKEFIPAMAATNLSVLLLVTVDGLVLGNLVGGNALAAVNVFYPVTMFIGTASVLLSSGAATSMSTCMGTNDQEALQRIKTAVVRLTIVAAVFIGIVQIPIVSAIIESYNLSPETREMTYQYSIGIMVSMPLGLISTVGTCQLQIAGKMKVLMWFSIMEGIANLLLDLLFVGPLHMGVLGGGMGTACANVIRSSATVIYLMKVTDTFKLRGAKPLLADYKDILFCGAPDAANDLMIAFQNYAIMQIIINAFGDAGGVIKGVCVFCFSLVNVFIGGVQGSMRPLVGLLTGMKDWEGVRQLMRQCLTLVTAFALAGTLLVVAFPEAFYTLHGVDVIPEAGELSLRLFSTYFVFRGYNTIFRLYYANRKDQKFATGLTVLGNLTLPLFAMALVLLFPPAFLWLSYLLCELLMFILNLARYKHWFELDNAEIEGVEVLSLTVKPDGALEASRQIREFANEHGYPERFAYRAALCMEELVAYAKTARGKDDIEIMIVVRFAPDSCVFSMLDDGESIVWDIKEEPLGSIADNYSFVQCIARSVEYQYILGLNQTIVHI